MGWSKHWLIEPMLRANFSSFSNRGENKGAGSTTSSNDSRVLVPAANPTPMLGLQRASKRGSAAMSSGHVEAGRLAAWMLR